MTKLLLTTGILLSLFLTLSLPANFFRYEEVAPALRPEGAPYVNGRFRNPHLPEQNRFLGFLRWRLGWQPADELGPQLAAPLPPYRPEIRKPDLNHLNHPDPATIQLTWLGHATFLIQVAGLNLLTDPIFSDRASPVSFLGPRRLVPPPLSLKELPPIHAVLISHNHYDHLDRPTVQALGPQTAFFTPLGLKSWFRRAGLPRVAELDWWQQTTFGSITLTALPTQHFSIRFPGDTNKTLWCGWLLSTPVGRIFFVGDTGYSPDFAAIGRRFGPIRLALLPIGGYRPRWFMRPMHLDPPEAVQVHFDLQAQQSVGMHWGTFRLTDEDPAEPPIYLRQAAAQASLPPDRFLVLDFGETRIFRPEPH